METMTYLTASEKLSLAKSQIRERSIIVGAWTITSNQDVDKDWHYYGKAWHRSHGPKVTVSDRKLTFQRKHGAGILKRVVELSSWSGDFVANAIVSLGIEPKKPTTSLRIRLNKAYNAKLIEKKRGYKIYSRTLLGQHHDWVIESPLGMIYHDADRGNLVKGLHKKIRNQSRKISGAIDWKKCRSLGFCETGIKQFCADFGLSIKSAYSPLEIHTRIKQDIQKAIPYLHELKILADAVGYNVPEL